MGWQFLPAIEPRASPYVWDRSRADLDQKWSYGWDQTVLRELDTITRAWDQVVPRRTCDGVGVGPLLRRPFQANAQTARSRLSKSSGEAAEATRMIPASTSTCPACSPLCSGSEAA